MVIGFSSFSLLVLLSITCCLLWFIYPRCRYYFKKALYTVCLVMAGTIGTILSLPHGRTPKNHGHTFRAFQLLTFWCGITYEIRNRKHIESDEPFVIVANHQSSLDVLGLTHVWPENCVVLLKSSLRFMPGFNLCAYLCEAVFINRFSKEKAYKSVEQAIETIKNNRKMWIFPEGTRNPCGTMLPFKKGAFIMAREAKVPIVPIVFSPYQSFYQKAECKFDYGGRVIIEVLPPIDSTSFPDVDSLSDACRKQMEIVYHKLSDEISTKY